MLILTGVVSIALGDQHSMIVKEDGSVWSTGYNEYGQLGDSSVIDNIKFAWAFVIDACKGRGFGQRPQHGIEAGRQRLGHRSERVWAARGRVDEG